MCLGACQTELPEEQYFLASMIKEWIAEKTLNVAARCVRCVLAEKPAVTDEFECAKCFKTKRIQDFATFACKQFLTTDSKVRGAQTYKWYCQDCLHPPCLLCRERPLYNIPVNAYVNEKDGAAPSGPGYYCETCKFPACPVRQCETGTQCGHTRSAPNLSLIHI